ncbi:MAG: dihydrodipicolinate synthase family protein, partial [bacterium]|nr:dihydrodipicolinate synthase family protein [bacterium]
IRYYLQIFNQIKHPIFLYNMPKNTMIEISDTMLEALLPYSNLIGMKDSSGSWDKTRYFIEKYRQLHIFVGTDLLFKQAIEFGSGGGITAVANSFPELAESLFMSLNTNQDTDYLNGQLVAYRELIEKYPLQAATKYILKLRGLGDSAVRPPLPELSEAQKRELERGLEDLKFNFQNIDEDSIG